MTNDTELVRTHEAAEQLGIKPRQVYEKIDAGELEAVIDDGMIKIPATSIQDNKARRRSGPPPTAHR